MSIPVRFVKFNPAATYELKGQCGTTLDMYGAYYWYDRYDKSGIHVNYDGRGQRRNGLMELLKLKADFYPLATLWEIMPDGTKTMIVDGRGGRVQIDKRSLQKR